MPGGVGVLTRLGLADAVGGAPFYGVRYYTDGLVAHGRFPAASRVPTTRRGQRRRHLDQVLFAAAAATSGVTARTGMRADAPLWEGRRVAGLIVAQQERRARLVVAADGAHSYLRRLLGLDGSSPRRRRVGVRTHFRLAPGHVQPPWVEIFLGQGYELYITPLLARQTLRVLKATPALFSSLIGIAGGVHECFYRAGLLGTAHRAHLA